MISDYFFSTVEPCIDIGLGGEVNVIVIHVYAKLFGFCSVVYINFVTYLH